MLKSIKGPAHISHHRDEQANINDSGGQHGRVTRYQRECEPEHNTVIEGFGKYDKVYDSHYRHPNMKYFRVM